MDTRLDRALVIFVGVVCTPVGWSTEYFKTAENETGDGYAICLAWIFRPTP